MRLISLAANRVSFKTVNFNRTGLTLIVGKHRAAKRTDLKKTYNGVGKSLIVALINYCLGSNKNEQFDTHLKDWTFVLTFEQLGQVYFVSRTTGNNKLRFNNEELSLSKFKERLDDLNVFKIPSEGVGYLSFRSLLGFFMRPKHSSYVRYDKPHFEWKDYQSVLCQSFLLGLDFHRAVRKHEHKKHLDEQLALADRYRKDSDLRQFYVGEKNAEVELAELDNEIDRLEQDLAAFRVADDYAERQTHANSLHDEIDAIANEVVILKNVAADIELSLTIKPDVLPEQIKLIYEEAKAVFPDQVLQRLNDVHDFYQRLQNNRQTRLAEELAQTRAKIAASTRRADHLRRDLDLDLQFLNAHRALDEYAANSAFLSELRGRRQRIRDYLQLLTQYTEEAQRTRADMALATVETNEYLKTQKSHLEMLMERFRVFSRELYGPVPAGLTIKNNDGENQCRYTIEAHIENDAADGINQGKIFCYDLLLLALSERHSMKFLFHDNRLFADMDKHQRFSLFRLADRVCKEMDLQYIATLNEDVIDSIRELAGGDFERLFVDPVVLELTDAPGGVGKLLGIQVDMAYDDDH